MNRKSCNSCCEKDGFQRNAHQRYECISCNRKLQKDNKSRPSEYVIPMGLCNDFQSVVNKLSLPVGVTVS